VQQIITEDLGLRKISAEMVPWILTDDKHLLHISSDVLHSAEMFERIITGDETWCFQYDPETKCQNMQWKTQNSPWLKKVCMSHSHCLCVSSITRGQFIMNSLHKDKQ
jgi:hypothetical protein